MLRVVALAKKTKSPRIEKHISWGVQSFCQEMALHMCLGTQLHYSMEQ